MHVVNLCQGRSLSTEMGGDGMNFNVVSLEYIGESKTPFLNANSLRFFGTTVH